VYPFVSFFKSFVFLRLQYDITTTFSGVWLNSSGVAANKLLKIIKKHLEVSKFFNNESKWIVVRCVYNFIRDFQNWSLNYK